MKKLVDVIGLIAMIFCLVAFVPSMAFCQSGAGAGAGGGAIGAGSGAGAGAGAGAAGAGAGTGAGVVGAGCVLMSKTCPVQARQAQPVRQARRQVVLLWRALASVRLQRPLQLWRLVWRQQLRRRQVRVKRPRHTQPRLTTNRFFVWKDCKRRKQAARNGVSFRLFCNGLRYESVAQPHKTAIFFTCDF